MKVRYFSFLLITGLALIFIRSAISPHDLFTWFLEVAPVIIGAVSAIVFAGRLHDSFLSKPGTHEAGER